MSSSFADHITGAWSSPRGQLVVTHPAADVITFTFAGHLDVTLARRIAASVDKLVVAGLHPHVFNDWARMTGYDSAARMQLTEWALRQRSLFQSVHLLLGSRLVAMGVSVANLAIGGIIHPYMDRAAYERALAHTSLHSTPHSPARP